MIATALRLPEGDNAARAAKWRQLVDLLAQAWDELATDTREAAVAAIARVQPAVTREQRARTARALAGRGAAVMLFADDEPAIAAPVLVRAQLGEAAWLALIPRLPGPSRALLRNRRDLPGAVIVLLDSFGPADLALPAADVSDGADQIRELVARIEAFRKQAGPEAAVTRQAEAFAFETDAEGIIQWVEGVPRGALIGLVIAEPALSGGFGVDGQVAGAFRRRAPFRDARLLLAAGQAAGAWRVSGQPVFNTRDGRFAGYRVTGRRPRAEEAAESMVSGEPTLSTAGLRALLHELRTPLNAILGFAMMIEEQLLGPAQARYREHAHAIVVDGQRLCDLIDEIDQMARPLSSAQAGGALANVRDALREAVARQVPTEPGGPRVVVTGDAHVALVHDGPGFVRATARLAAELAARASVGESLVVQVTGRAEGADITIGLPHDLRDGAYESLLARARADEEDPAAAPGFGFTLRLFEAAVRAAAGRVTWLPDRIVVSIAAERVFGTTAQ